MPAHESSIKKILSIGINENSVAKVIEPACRNILFFLRWAMVCVRVLNIVRKEKSFSTSMSINKGVFNE